MIGPTDASSPAEIHWRQKCARDCLLCHIAAQRARVNPGFYYAAELSDPGGLLARTSKKLRHIEVWDCEEADIMTLRHYIGLSPEERTSGFELKS